MFGLNNCLFHSSWKIRHQIHFEAGKRWSFGYQDNYACWFMSESSRVNMSTHLQLPPEQKYSRAISVAEIMIAHLSESTTRYFFAKEKDSELCSDIFFWLFFVILHLFIHSLSVCLSVRPSVRPIVYPSSIHSNIHSDSVSILYPSIN